MKGRSVFSVRDVWCDILRLRPVMPTIWSPDLNTGEQVIHEQFSDARAEAAIRIV
jgi:hypothetical protein